METYSGNLSFYGEVMFFKIWRFYVEKVDVNPHFHNLRAYVTSSQLKTWKYYAKAIP